MRNVRKTIRLAPFSNKYVEYVRKSEQCYINVLEGAIRSGKTIVNLVAFSKHLDSHPNGGIFIASSATSSLAWEILAENRGNNSADGKYGADQGFGLLYLFGGRCRKTKVKGSNALEIVNKLGKKCYVVFVGAKNSGSVETIRGLTISGGWIATELSNHICQEDEDFIGFMFGRMLGAENAKCFLDLNPTYPTHRMYTEHLDKFAADNTISYNYLKCNLTDNSALTEQQINSTLALYTDKTSVMYKRDILGERAASSGTIFTMFSMNREDWYVNSIQGLPTNAFISLGIDFGGNGSNTAMVATYISRDYKHVIPIANDEIKMSIPENATVQTYRARLTNFINNVKTLAGGIPILYAYGDSADPVMLNETIATLRQASPVTKVYGSVKRTIKERIDLKSAMMSTKHWQIFDSCNYIIKSTAEQLWNPKLGHEDERLDDGTCDIDIADAEEYSWSAFYNQLNKANIR